MKLNEEKVQVLLLEEKKIADEKWTKTVNTDFGVENGEMAITEMDVIPSEKIIEISNMSKSVEMSNTEIGDEKEKELNDNKDEVMLSTFNIKENTNNKIKNDVNLSLLLPCNSNDSIDESEMNIVEKIQINTDNSNENKIEIDVVFGTTVIDNNIDD